jgi:hypothetical protein
MTRIGIQAPEVTGQTVTFRWLVDPPTPLYRRSTFRLRFPASVDLGRVPEHIWWIVALACLHAHWPLLRPCRVELPVALGAGEAETWLRLTDAAVATLESLRGTTHFHREIEIIEGTTPLVPVRVPDGDRCATAFSGGKDSLVHAGLLAELTVRPVLVTTTSPLPKMHDHLTSRRRYVLAEIPRRRTVTHVEVESDFRACWANDYSYDLGYKVAVNELTDTLLYFGATLATAVALGVSHLFLASETEVQQNSEWAGRIVQHPHFMYSTVTQRVLQTLLRPAGVRYGSLTSPLHSYQVQGLLWTRYKDLRDLQYSCWEVGEGQSACSACRQCLRLALCALALGDNPQLMGVDLARLFWAQRGWQPPRLEGDTAANLPGQFVQMSLESQTCRFLQATPVGRVARILAAEGRARVAHPRVCLALLSYARLRRRAADVGPAPGFREGFLPLLDPLIRDRVAAIFREHYPAEPHASYAAILERSHRLVGWITEPIGGES